TRASRRRDRTAGRRARPCGPTAGNAPRCRRDRSRAPDRRRVRGSSSDKRTGCARDARVCAMDPWVQEASAAIAGRAERELEALVAVSSPSGDAHGAAEAAAMAAALAPDAATLE